MVLEWYKYGKKQIIKMIKIIKLNITFFKLNIMTTFNNLPADIIFVIALLLHPTDLYNFALIASKYAQIIKSRNVINYHLKEINEIREGCHVTTIKYFVIKHTGKRHGLHESWYENGQKHSQSNYQNDKAHGLNKCWHDNGQKFIQIHYQNGKKHGMYEFYVNGRKFQQIMYQNDKPNGESYFLSDDGRWIKR